MQTCSRDVRSYSPAASNLVPTREGTAKWRFGTSQSRHSPLFSTTFLRIFAGFFREPFPSGANGSAFGPEQRWCKARLARFKPRPSRFAHLVLPDKGGVYISFVACGSAAPELC
jgi:hypothetical protein